jgi:hypothetical protein
MRHPGHLLFASVILIAFASSTHAAPPNPYTQQLIAASTSGTLSQLQPTLDAQARLAVQDLARLDSTRVISVASAREFARYFGSIRNPTPQQRETLAWLAAQPHLMPTLMSAVVKSDPPAQILNLLRVLGAPQNPTLDRYPDLVTAMLVVWDKGQAKDETPVRTEFTPDRFVHLFGYYTNSRNPLRFTLPALCWQLEVYVIDIKISDAEMQWAANRYANNFSIGSIYFDVNYDERRFYQGDAKKIATHDYTLQNILEFGGVCVEQSYFAEQIAKTLGNPACMCTSAGGGAGQAAHAWIGLLTFSNNQYLWDFTQGRYPEDLFWSADITDPQTHEHLTDADVALLAALQHVNPDVRLLSTMLLKLSDLMPAGGRFDILTREIEVSPGNRPAWAALADLAKKNQLAPEQKQALMNEIDRQLLQPYPDFACQMLMRTPSGQPPTDQVNTLDRVAQAFPNRPDLRARVRLKQADLLIGIHHDDQAFGPLNDVLTNDLNAGAIILQAMSRTDRLMRARKDLPALMGVYSRVWPRMPAPERSAYAFDTPYYLVGKAYMDLLESTGNHQAAQGVRNHLVAVIPAGADIQ